MKELEYQVVGNGETTLIIETGIGGSFYHWYPFIEEIKEDFTIVLYHRAGYGKSPASKVPRTTGNIAEELNDLIGKIGITNQFVLMGHSFGGLCSQQYAKMFPEKVKGLVLVDSTSFNFQQLYSLNIPVMNSLISLNQMIHNYRETSKKSKAEIKSMYKELIDENKKQLPSKESRDYEELITNPLLFKTIANEFENWDSSSENIKNMGAFPNIPLIVIARDKEVSVKAFQEYDIPLDEAVLYEDVWRELQIELSELSSQGELVIADGSDHEVHIDKPDIIIQSLKRFLK